MRVRTKATGIALVLLVGSIVSCAATQKVAEINDGVNDLLAKVADPLAFKEAQAGEAWRGPVAEIDEFIAAHPGHERLTAALRVRQAMLLTVYGQSNLARAKWKLVRQEAGGQPPTTERSRVLLAASEQLVWWFPRSQNPRPFDEAEQREADLARDRLGSVISGVEPPSEATRWLGTLRAQIALKQANDSGIETVEQKSSVESLLSTSLRDYALLLGAESADWLTRTPAPGPDGAPDPREIRDRAWLEQMIRDYKDTASALSDGVPEELMVRPDWEPDWIESFD